MDNDNAMQFESGRLKHEWIARALDECEQQALRAVHAGDVKVLEASEGDPARLLYLSSLVTLKFAEKAMLVARVEYAKSLLAKMTQPSS